MRRIFAVFSQSPDGVLWDEAGGDSGAADAGGASGTSDGGTATPAAITLSDDSLIQAPGSTKPVAFKQFIGSYVPKSELTRMRQADTARAQQEQEQWRTAERQRLDAELRAQYQRQQQGQQATQQAANVLSDLKARPYLTGEQAAAVLEQTIVPLAQALQQMRNEYTAAIQMMHGQLGTVQKTVGGFSAKDQETRVNGLIGGAITKLGVPDTPAWRNTLMSHYQAHEGWSGDVDEFAEHFKADYDELQKSLRDADRQKAENARRARFPNLAGKGGNARPGQNLNRGFQTPAQVADAVWPMFQNGQNT